MSTHPHPSLNLYFLKYLSFRIKLPIKKLHEIIETQSSQVTKFNLKKSNTKGVVKSRLIYNPSPEYKKILRNINKYLFGNYTYPEGICGGIKGKSLIDMVEVHCRKESMYSVDIKNFYPSISEERVFNFFKRCGCSEEITSILTKVTTFENHLPQGFPTSTLLANLILHNLDEQHINLAETYNLYRTRWIDDIVFSGRIMYLEKAIPKINKIIKINNFQINKEKSKFVRRNESPEVVGLGVNKSKPYVPKCVIDKVEEMIDVALNNDLDLVKDLYNLAGNPDKVKNLIKGKISFIDKYNPSDGTRLKEKFNKLNLKIAIA